MKKIFFLVISTLSLLLTCCVNETTTLKVVDLTCEYLDTPLGIDVVQPRLGWRIEQTADSPNGQLQTAYQIIVSSSPEKLAANEGDLWNSGKVKSAQSFHIVYAGKTLQSMQQYYWKVKIWNNKQQVSDWSQSAMWGTGIMKPDDWQANWIGDQPDTTLKTYVDYIKVHRDKKKTGFDSKIGDNPPLLPSPMLRKQFHFSGDIKSAYLYVSSLGSHEISINGERIGNHQLAPEWTDYDKRVQYQTCSLTKNIRQGENVLSAVLADGWYLGELGPVRWQREYAFPLRGFYGIDRRLIAQLVIELTNGDRQIIATDESWKINPDGYILSADNFAGQTVDARKMIPGWDAPGFDDSQWNNVYVDTEINKNLEAQKNEPIRIHQVFKPVKITTYKDKYIIHFDQNIAGWCALKIKGKRGTIVTLRHGEWLNDDGSIYTAALGYAKETDTFILSGNEDCFEPRFTYHGFQYVEISGLQSAPSPDMIVAKAVSSAPEVTGQFECSNPKLNQLFRNILWTQQNNLYSVPTDCPQRDERCGWMGDAQVFCQTSIFNMDMAAFYTKFVKDMRDAIAPNGQFHDIVPSVRNADLGIDRYGGPAWADAGVIIPWKIYENYADLHLLKEHYPAMKTYVESVLSENPNLLWTKPHMSYNDWLNANTFSNPHEDYNTQRGNMPNDVFSTAFFANSARLLSKVAAALGYEEDKKKYCQLADNIADAFTKAFVDKDTLISGNSQAAYAIALHFDLLPENLRPKMFDNLIKCIEEYDCRISTGMVTTRMMMQELVRNNRTDIAYSLLESERFPSWIYPINQGTTTVWERWDAYVKGRGIHPSNMNSFDHYSIGSVGEWMYCHILGINPDAEHPGYKHFTIHPRLGGTLTWAKGTYRSIYGEIASSWKLEDGNFVLEVKIPVNTTATIILPGKEKEPVKVGSGKYKFTVPVNKGNSNLSLLKM